MISNIETGSTIKQILVAVELTPEDRATLSMAIHLAKAFTARLWLLHVARPDPEFVGYEIGPQYIRDDRAEELRKEHRLIQQHTKNLKDMGIDAAGLLIQGATVEMILEESGKLNIDLICMGHHDHSFLYKAFMGSVSSQIIRKSGIPVLVVPD